MGLQSTEGESGGMKKWFDDHYGTDGYMATEINQTKTRLRLPKQADNFGELIVRAYEERGAICDLTIDASNKPELIFWSDVCSEKKPGGSKNIYTWAARLCAALAAVFLLIAATDYIFASPL